ncbi:cell wall-binding repeat-containing protein [Clostridium senegalense]|uniref:cell wall-binding repeat-containing protein n=1 Tax=Clostridium senegalense TaxID=1465809 RepID=UPI00028985AD|nr:cell wall-binding repeat-containing protein [Clostridium senegalense]
MRKGLKLVANLLLISTIVLGSTLSSIEVFAANNDLMGMKKLHGNDRFSTAVEVSKDGWGYSNYVIIANGFGFADALCSAPLSKTLDAPILLTDKTSLPTSTKREIERLNARRVYIVGGAGAVSANVANQLKDMGLAVSRISGSDRYETSLNVAKEINKTNTVKDVVVASGEQVSQGVDALSIAPIAGDAKMPIILSPKNSMTSSSRTWLNSKHVHATYVIGGTTALSNNVFKQVPNGKRLEGRNRYETNLEILQEFSNYLDFDSVYMAKGEKSSVIDALTAGPISAREGNPLVLVSDTLDLTQEKFLSKYTPTHLTAIGGQLKDETIYQVGRVLNREIATGVSKVIINDKRRITVEFNGIVNGYEASKKNNYTICGSMVQEATIQPDYRTVVLRLKYDLDKSALLNFEGEAENILGINMNYIFNKGNTNIEDNVTDGDKPRVLYVQPLDTIEEGGNKLLVKFSEKVMESDARRFENYRIKRRDGSYLRVNDIVFNKETEDEAILYTESLDYAGRYLIEIDGIKDLAENIMEPYSNYIDIFDTGALKVIEYKVRTGEYYNSKKVDIIFNKKVDKIMSTQTRNYRLLDAQGKPINDAVTPPIFDEYSRDRVTVDLINLKYDGDYTLEVSGVTDLSGNTIARTKLELRNLIVEKPKVIDTDNIYVSNVGSDGKCIVKFNFNQELNKDDSTDSRNYKLVYDGYNHDANIDEIKYDYGSGKSTVTLYLSNVTDGNYTLTVDGIRNIENFSMNMQQIHFKVK